MGLFNAMSGLDAYDAVVQAAEGDLLGAGLSLLGFFDLGYIGNLAKVEVATKRVELAAEALSKRGTLNANLTKALGGRPSPAHTAHHVIPVDMLDNSLVQKAIEGGFDFNGVENGTWAVQVGGHRSYSSKIRKDLNDLSRDYPDLSPSEAADALRDFARDERDNLSDIGEVVR